jgi:hypothetical protein
MIASRCDWSESPVVPTAGYQQDASDASTKNSFGSAARKVFNYQRGSLILFSFHPGLQAQPKSRARFPSLDTPELPKRAIRFTTIDQKQHRLFDQRLENPAQRSYCRSGKSGPLETTTIRGEPSTYLPACPYHGFAGIWNKFTKPSPTF